MAVQAIDRSTWTTFFNKLTRALVGKQAGVGSVTRNLLKKSHVQLFLTHWRRT